MARYEFLDSLRGIAIFGVVMTHVGHAVPGMAPALSAFANFGLRGVQLFFVVSALTLCLVSKPATIDCGLFYIRRFFRIAPMFYAAAIFYLMCPLIFGVSFSPNKITAFDIATTFLFVHGFNPHGIDNVVPGGWSIASEAIFYAIFPLILLKIKTVKQWLIITALSFFIAMLNNAVPNLFKIHDLMWKDFFHFNFLSNFPAFSTGIALFLILKASGMRQKRGVISSLGSVAVVLACIVVGCFNAKIPAVQIVMTPVLGFLVFIAARYESPIFVNRYLSFVGDISFSIYLVHFAVLHALGSFEWIAAPVWIRFVLLYAATMSISAVVAWGCYRLVEQPMIALGRRVTTRASLSAANTTAGSFEIEMGLDPKHQGK